MINCVFPAGCMASYVMYLLRIRADRVHCYMGDPFLFAVLRALLRTDNGVTTGVMCWECYVEPGLAIKLCSDWVQRWLLAGADVAAVPRLLVVHLEPCFGDPSKMRTCVHWVVANVHLGLGLSIRPYVHTRSDFHGLVGSQNIINILGGWRIPSLEPAGLYFVRNDDLVCRDIVRTVRVGLDQVRASEDLGRGEKFYEQLQYVVETCNRDELWDGVVDGKGNDAPGWAAIIRESNDESYTLKFQNGLRVAICGFRQPKKITRDALAKSCPSPASPGVALDPERHQASFERLMQRRAALFKKYFGGDWCRPLDCPAAVRSYLLEIRIPEVPKTGEPTREDPSVNIEYGSPVRSESPTPGVDF